MTQYQESLLSLAGAIGSGMDPSTAYSIYQTMLGQQASQVAARRERIGSLVDLVTQGALSGLPEDQTQMLLSAQTGGNLPPKVSSAMESVYPAPDQSMPGWAVGTNQSISPLYQGPPAEEQIAQAQLQGLQQEQVAQASAQAAVSQMAPGLAKAFTSAAMRLTEPQPMTDANGQPVVDPATGQPAVQPGITGQQALTQVVMSPEFVALPPETQTLVMQSIQAAIAEKNAARAQAEQAAATEAAQGPSQPSEPGMLENMFGWIWK